MGALGRRLLETGQILSRGGQNWAELIQRAVLGKSVPAIREVIERFYCSQLWMRILDARISPSKIAGSLELNEGSTGTLDESDQ